MKWSVSSKVWTCAQSCCRPLQEFGFNCILLDGIACCLFVNGLNIYFLWSLVFVHMIRRHKIYSYNWQAVSSTLLNSDVTYWLCNRLHHTNLLLPLASSKVNSEALNVKEHRVKGHEIAILSSCAAHEKEEKKKRAIINGHRDAGVQVQGDRLPLTGFSSGSTKPKQEIACSWVEHLTFLETISSRTGRYRKIKIICLF